MLCIFFEKWIYFIQKKTTNLDNKFSIILLYRIFTGHLLSFRNILFNIFSIYNLIISIANLTSIPNDSKINPKINSIYLIYLH